MDLHLINPLWPNALRWFLTQGSTKFAPWQLLQQPDEFASAASAFEREDFDQRRVFCFAMRRDSDDFAGLELVNEHATERVIVFHPVFSNTSAAAKNWDIVIDTYADVFEFFAQCVVPDMRDWASTEDASNL